MFKNSSSSIQGSFSDLQALQVCSPEAIKHYMANKIIRFLHQVGRDELFFQMDKFARLEVQMHRINPLHWLSAQKNQIKNYWCDRELEFEMAGIGVADMIATDESVSHANVFRKLRNRLPIENKNLRYYGGIRFYNDREVDQGWDKFGNLRFIVPRWELHIAGDATTFACNILFAPGQAPSVLCDTLLSELEHLTFSDTHHHSPFPCPVRRIDSPDELAWRDIVEKTLQAFNSNELQKIVLARKTLFTLSDDLEPLSLMQRLKSTNPNLFYFYFQPEEHIAFLGGSPERLYRKENRMLKSEAIAGTRSRGSTLEQDQDLMEELLHCDKDLREHQFVVENIKENLEKLCHTVDIDDEITILKLAQVQHLRCRLQGILAEDISDAEILQIMHPTPAVGGSPTEKAIAAIKKLEPFDRGWYAAPVGWISHDASEFVVAIRSGLVDKKELALFSGAGIVKGSTPEGEWAEIENKIANFMKAIMAK